MKKVITYGTYDLLHYGHIRLLERAKALGDYLIVGVTSDDFDRRRGKINVQQSVMERVQAVRNTGLADEIIIEEYEGQKIDDIKQNNIDIFAIGSDWKEHFDYLCDYCEVVYLDRTEGISSTALREFKNRSKLGLVGDSLFLNKIMKESEYVNGIYVNSICTQNISKYSKEVKNIPFVTNNFNNLIENVDSVYIRSQPNLHFEHIKIAINQGKHVLCESPITLHKKETKLLFELANSKNLILMEAIKTAYATAYQRCLLLVKSGIIGNVVSVETTCTSLKNNQDENEWRGFFEWGPTALLPIFQILGTDYIEKETVELSNDNNQDLFIRISFQYKNAVALLKVGNGVKSEGEMVISGTNGYIYIPSPWWKTDYFEVRYEDRDNNQRFFYQLDGEGIRNELSMFVRSVEKKEYYSNIDKDVSIKISEVMEDFLNKEKVKEIVI